MQKSKLHIKKKNLANTIFSHPFDPATYLAA